VSDYKEDDDDDNANGGIRRSKRTKFAPLAYWKNERLAYEAHHEGGTLGEAMGDMPVVAGAIQALPTPYKERKAVPPKKKKSKKRRGKNGDDDDDSYDDSTYADREIKPFDTKKLRSVSTRYFVVIVIVLDVHSLG
jgi:centromere protein C